MHIQLDRDLDMKLTGKRHPFHAKFSVGHDRDGLLLGAQVELVSDGGWSLDLSQPILDRALFHLDNAYYIPAVDFTGRIAKTNVTSHTAFRGFGGPQGIIVIEEIIDRVARRLGLPPEVVRQRNLYRGTGETNRTHYFQDIGDNRIQDIWAQVLAKAKFAERRATVDAWNAVHPHMKRGLAVTPVKFGISFTLTHYNQAGAYVVIYTDGSVQVNHGGTEMGQGPAHEDPRRGDARAGVAGGEHPVDDDQHGQGAEHFGDRGVQRRGPERRRCGGGLCHAARAAGGGWRPRC